MKITKTQLARIIKEEMTRLLEVGSPPDPHAEGWHPNDSQEWERQARSGGRAEDEAEKQAFMDAELTRWNDEFEPYDDEQANIIKGKLSDCYDAIYKELTEPYGGY